MTLLAPTLFFTFLKYPVFHAFDSSKSNLQTQLFALAFRTTIKPTGMCLDCGRKTKNAHTGRTSKLHTEEDF